MKTISIRAALGAGWGLFMKRPWYLLGLSLAVGFLFVATTSNSALATALSYIVFGGYIAVLLKFSSGESVVFDDLFITDKRWIYLAFLALIKMVLILLGFLCFIIPGVYLSIRWMFADLLVIDKGLRPLEALRASSALTLGHRWKLFFFSLVSGLLVLLGLVFFIIGAVPAAIAIQFATIHLYKTLQTPDAPADAV
jgi:uncharacterized membrane protein